MRNFRWATLLTAWWGSFRIGELLPKRRHNFDPLSTLLASDVKFHDNSAAFWIRSPKIERQKLGDIVEAGQVPKI